MNNLLRTAFKINSCRAFLNPTKKLFRNAASIQQQQIARNLRYMTNPRINEYENKSNRLCTGCLNRQAHSKAEQELVEFLTEEILTERKTRRSNTLPTEVDGFKVKLDGAEVTLNKDCGEEKVKICFNVNHTVDTESEPEIHPNMDKPEFGELKSKPAFRVEILRGKTTLQVLCSFVSLEEGQGGDIYEVDEISIYDGEFHDNIYAVSGEVLDSYLYDLILNYLEEKGISNEFVEKLSQFSTSYEHSAYIGLLEGLSKFVGGK